LYQEAGKCVKYGGMSEEDALKAITINAAKQLGLEKRIGSLEIGKDADLTIFNGHPLNSYSRVEMTLVEGEVHFQRGDSPTTASLAQKSPAKPSDGKLPTKIPQGLYYIHGATVHPVSGPPVANCTVVVDGNKIRDIGANAERLVRTAAARLTAEGLHIYPGL